MTLQGKILGIDYGKKRHGIAVSDALGMMAHPRDFVPADKESFIHIQDIIESDNIAKIVVGMPIALSGQRELMAQEVAQFIEQLREKCQLEVIEWDERLSTAQAEKAMIGQDIKRNKRKLLRDGLAATLILQSYLDANAAGGAAHFS